LVLLSGAVLIGAQLLLARYEGAVVQADLFGDRAAGAATPRRSDITGPLNILLVGIDPRATNPDTPPLADSIMVVHVPAGLDRAVLFSLPRDLLVEIPRFEPSGFPGGRHRLNSAMAFGSRVPGRSAPDPARGFELLATTIGDRTGLTRFDAGVIVNFVGFQRIVDAMGGVDMYIDTDVRSEHREPDGSHRRPDPDGDGYVGPQAEYRKGHAHLEGWQALDYVRQRKTLPNGDYDRQRHQQQFVKAMVDQALSRDVVTNPVKLDAVLRAAGRSVVFSGRGHSVTDFALALRGLRADTIRTVKLPGVGVGRGASYRGERFTPIADGFFAAVRAGTVENFLLAHPELADADR
ncbi:MAG TPA: LCP family protein, partial [Micromonospora sp.]